MTGEPTIIGNATLYEGDCLEILPTLDKVDALLLDPPFDQWQYVRPRLGQETTIAFCSPQSRHVVEGIFGPPRCELVWHFPDGRWVSNSLPRTTHDYIYIYGNTSSAAVGDSQDTTRQKKGKSAIGRDTLGNRVYTPKARKHLNSVQLLPRNMSGPLGAWGKPQKLIDRLIKWVNPRMTLDPYMGGGTTGVACAKLGRSFIGIEIEPKYFDIACKRIEAAYAQGDLFIEPPAKPEQLDGLASAGVQNE